jgi:hypothetical protein
MDVSRFVETIHQQLLTAAEAGGDDTRAVAERLTAPLDAAVRLAVQDALTAAAEEITCELAPGSVEVRLRGRDPEFVVTLPPPEQAPDEVDEGPRGGERWPMAGSDADDGTVARINLRLPDHLKARVEAAAAAEGLSINAWLVRAVTAGLERTSPPRRPERWPQGSQRYTGWAR